MKRGIPVFLSVALMALTAVQAALAFGSPAHTRPPGISASAWIPISNDLAAVVEQLTPDPIQVPGRNYVPGQPLPTLGYFVVWRGNHWLRLDSLVQETMFSRPPMPPSTRMLIDKHLAFVVERQLLGQPMRSQPTLAALGYFVIKRSGRWVRLEPVAEGALYRGPLTSRPSSDWIPIGRSLRFVIEQQAPERYAPGQLPSVLGYFMGKHAGHWVRLGSIA
jgi:hypothetical protein